MINRELDLKVGQEVVVKIEVGSNDSRYVEMSLENIDKWCFDGEVIKVGRKYITVKFNNYREEQFEIESDYKQKSTRDYKIYLNKEEVIKECKSNQLYHNIKSKFIKYDNNNIFTLDKLERIMNIINE